MLIAGITSAGRAAIALSEFTATYQGNQILLEWKTESELDSLGFYVVRSEQEKTGYTRISIFLPSRGTSLKGADYEYTDDEIDPDTTYYYKLEEIDINNQSYFFGPVFAGPPTPTPTATSPNTATITPTPSSTSNPTRTNTPNPSFTRTLTASPTLTVTYTVTNTPTVTDTPTNTVIVEPTELSFPTETPTFTEVPVPAPSSGQNTAIILRVGIIVGLIIFWGLVGYLYYQYTQNRS